MSEEIKNDISECTYKVVFEPNTDTLRSLAFEKTCLNLCQAESVLSAISDYTLFLHDEKMMPDHSNVGMVMQLIDGEWIEIDGDGNII